jgi:hypothetical protein
MGGVDVQSQIFLTSALGGGEWSASHPGHFTPRERAPSTQWIRGWVDTAAALDDMKRWRMPLLTIPHSTLMSGPVLIGSAESYFKTSYDQKN